MSGRPSRRAVYPLQASAASPSSAAAICPRARCCSVWRRGTAMARSAVTRHCTPSTQADRNLRGLRCSGCPRTVRTVSRIVTTRRRSSSSSMTRIATNPITTSFTAAAATTATHFYSASRCARSRVFRDRGGGLADGGGQCA